MLLVEALLLLIDSLIVLTAILIIPISIVTFVWYTEFRMDDE
jgi:hypothetical protein